MSDGINVIVRKRPMKHNDKGNDNILADIPNNIMEIYESKTKVNLVKYEKVHKFPFDKVYSDDSTTKSVYDKSIKAHIMDIFNGHNFVCYAYGQTGSGKTHTIFGNEKSIGLIPLAALDIFSYVNSTSYIAKISAYEIYNDDAYDLLNNKVNVPLREGYNKILHIVGLTKLKVDSYEQFSNVLRTILSMRNTGISSQNDTSSRSHAIFELGIYEGEHRKSKLLFVDLAGSERASQSICRNKVEYRENAHINKSLLALKECIRAVKSKKDHIPFRSSKLTTILKDSFTTNCSTLVIGTISPGNNNVVDGLNTLLYTSSIKYIKKIDYASRVPNIAKPKCTNVYQNHQEYLNKAPMIFSDKNTDKNSVQRQGIGLPQINNNLRPMSSKKHTVKRNIHLPNISHTSCVSNTATPPNIHIIYESYENYIEKILQVCKLELDIVGNIRHSSNNNNNDKCNEYKNKISDLLNRKKRLINELNSVISPM